MHYYRICTLLLPLFIAVSSPAQEKQVRLNWQFAEGEKQHFEAWLKADFSGLVQWRLQDAQIEELRLSEGREKQELEYEYDGNLLHYTIPEGRNEHLEIYVRYAINWGDLVASPFINALEPGLVLNVLNIEEGLGNGALGVLFPAPMDGGPQDFQLAVKIPRSLKVSLPMELNFKVQEKEEQSLFYEKVATLNMRDFYLALGDFRRFKPEDIALDIEEQQRAVEDERIDAFQERYMGVINYVANAAEWMFTRQGMLGLSGIQPSDRAPDFPALHEAPRSLEEKRIELAILQEFFPKEWPYHWTKFVQERLADSTWKQLLERRFNGGDTGKLFWRSYLEMELHQHKLEWADSARELSSQDSLYMARARYFLEARSPLRLGLNYRMNFKDRDLQLIISHEDTALSILIELRGKAYLQADTMEWRIEAPITNKDTLHLPISESPRAVYLEPDPSGLLIWEEHRPLNFLLYDLAQRNRPLIRRAALLSLLESANPRLLATVIGIALDSGDPELQHLGLDKVNELRPDGRQRLQSTLEALANQNEDVKMKQKAKSLLQIKP